MDASYKIQRGIHVHLIQFFMCPEFWVHIMTGVPPFFAGGTQRVMLRANMRPVSQSLYSSFSCLWRGRNPSRRSVPNASPGTSQKRQIHLCFIYVLLPGWGTSASTFGPNAGYTRAQIVTFLFRTYQGK